ncbi:MAG TPA: hypothetical protein VMB80_01010 [Candidatus Acidoferrum sp.]|nr:hypothetical protein [Candidatus Acidoferrum sp.]
MKLALAGLIYLVLAAVLCTGILLMVAGNPWPLLISFVLYVVAFGKIGCLAQH